MAARTGEISRRVRVCFCAMPGSPISSRPEVVRRGHCGSGPAGRVPWLDAAATRHLRCHPLQLQPPHTRSAEEPGRRSASGLMLTTCGSSSSTPVNGADGHRRKQCTTAVRMFLRFLIADGKCAAGLEGSIPVLAHWRLSSLPRYLQSDEVELVIASCDPSTAVGKRDRAILLLLARLGLRAGDLVQLRLGDIDWKEAGISVSGKGRRQTMMPLTQEIGDAIASYIKDGRPQTAVDALFIRSRAPFRALANHAAISMIAAQAMRRAGVVCPSRGAAHVLRHSVASSMLRQGASLQEIAGVLRHRSTATTEIYAKVDVVNLRQIAQPWPEVKSC